VNKTKLHKKYRPLFSSKSRYYICTGGRGSGKSFSITMWIVLLMLFERGHTILFTRYTMSSAKISIIPEFANKLELLGMIDQFEITNDEIICKVTGSKIIFKGIKTSSGDQTANLKSLQGVTTWILDEAEELVDEEIFDKINLSIRKLGIQNRVVLILNPATKEHFIYNKFFQDNGVEGGWNGTQNNNTYIHTTYLDNVENLAESFLLEVEKMKLSNPDKFKHIVMGGWLDKAEGVVITNWKFGKFNPDGLQTLFGQDYGFSIDPTTLIEVAIDIKHRKVYVKEHLYKPGLTTTEITQINKTICGNKLIIADSAEPRLIEELKRQGCNIQGALKGPGSVNSGMALILDYEIIVEENSSNIAKEFNNFCYANKASQLFIDSWNHTIDPLRYVLSYNNTKSTGIYSI